MIFQHKHSRDDKFNGMIAYVIREAGHWLEVVFENGFEGLALREELTPVSAKRSDTPIYDALARERRFSLNG